MVQTFYIILTAMQRQRARSRHKVRGPMMPFGAPSWRQSIDHDSAALSTLSLRISTLCGALGSTHGQHPKTPSVSGRSSTFYNMQLTTRS
eukprot:2465234-Amphidinium_carterae.2